MKANARLLKVGATTFQVLAWVSMVIQVIVGLVVLVTGGPAVPVGGVEVPARVIGALNCLAGAIYFFVLLLISQIIRLLLEIRDHVAKSGTGLSGSP